MFNILTDKRIRDLGLFESVGRAKKRKLKPGCVKFSDHFGFFYHVGESDKHRNFVHFTTSLFQCHYFTFMKNCKTG